MKVSVFGLGYVGCVSAACFAKEGFQAVGVDINPEKVNALNAGQSTIIEEGIQELVTEVVEAGQLRATTDVEKAVAETEISLVCVGTPSRANGDIDLQYIERVCQQIGEVIRNKETDHIVVIRSTVSPGTIFNLVIPALEKASGKTHGEGFWACSNPEFLREGSSIKDFYDPPFTLIGSTSDEPAEKIKRLYAGVSGEVFVTEIPIAETVKYVCNCFHALKVGFANEIGNISKAAGVDSHEVMRIVCEDKKLNISPAYLKPGFAFGGSCLPKDLRALTYRAKAFDIPTPILSAVMESNRLQIERGVDMVLETGARKVGMLGLAFKEGTDDLRESPVVVLAERLIGKGLDLSIYDRFVSEAGVIGANKAFIQSEIPHIWSLMRESVKEVVEGSEVIVVGNKSPEHDDLSQYLREGQIVIDLARAFGDRISDEFYRGICW